MSAWRDLLPVAFQDALFLTGFAAILVGVAVRGRGGGNNRGLGLSIALVGVCLLVAGPVGKLLRWW